MSIKRIRLRQIKRAKKLYEKKEKKMNAVSSVERYCTVKESLAQSLKEVKLMREGKIPERSLDDLFKNIEKWTNED